MSPHRPATRCPVCKTLHAGTGRCTNCTTRIRGTRQQRGYGNDHKQQRAAWAPRVATGNIRCWRCDLPISAGASWHLGHDDHDRTIWRGPEHPTCNLSAAGKASHQ